MPDTGAELILCVNQRLARYLRAEHDRAQLAAGKTTWQPLAALTVGAWLDEMSTAALLSGTLPASATPRLVLTATQERLLWEDAIQTQLAGDEVALFDREGLAAAAAEGGELCEVWNLRPGSEAGEETQRFLEWRRQVRSVCTARQWLSVAAWRAWQIRSLAQGTGRLPVSVAFAGFDRYSPQEEELKRVLAQRGVTVRELEHGLDVGDEAHESRRVRACADRRAECQAAAAWAAAALAAKPDARLGIVAIELGTVREMLINALDDALHPEAVLAANADMPRRYNVSLGTPLARQPLVAVALELLAVAAQPHRVEQARLGALLCGPYWSAWHSEADGRARLDAAMRRHLPAWTAVPSWLSFLTRLERKGLNIATTRAHVAAWVQAMDSAGGKRSPSAWAEVFAAMLRAAGWPGERPLSSREWQAHQAWGETLEQLAGLDVVRGRVSLAEANRLLARLCRERVFQPETVGAPNVEVMGPLEAAGLRFDALWVLGVNDDVWPPAPRPNPLLPAELQRRARSSNASAEVQLEFARSVQQRLARAATQVVFSYARAEGDRPLRASPLLAGLPHDDDLVDHAAADAGGRTDLERIDDYQAPPLAAGEPVAGGAQLLKAQALCPAWAFYRYRLGAKPLDVPVEGLDARERGTLLHRVMEGFFAGRTQAQLQAMSESARTAAIDAAVTKAFGEFDQEREDTLPPRFAMLEQARLAQLLAQWLPLELARPVPFAVVAREETQQVDIEGVAVDLRADRVDELADGRRLIIDYKTGDPKMKGWEGERLAEPQLPVYATCVGEAPAAVSYARVRADDCGFVGLGAEAGLVEGVKAAPDWSAQLAQWQAAIAAVAREVRAGHAAVSFARAEDLKYCEVKPLLRLPEVKWQKESS